jgi:NAD(P)H dehydrogenase (quinone)
MANERRARVLVTGATGNVGGGVVRLLRDDPRLDVVAAVRNPGKTELGVRQVHFDFDEPDTMARALSGVDRILMVTGYTVDKLIQGKNFIDEARKAGVGYVVHLGSPGDDDTRVAHYGWEQLVERYLEWSGIMFTHLRPQIYMQNLLGYGGVGITDKGVLRQYVGDARLGWIDCADIAAVAALCLAEPGPHLGKLYRLSAEVRSYREIAEIMSEAVGQAFVYDPRPPAEFLANSLSAGAEPAYMRSVHDNYADLEVERGPGLAQTFPDFSALTGRPPRTLRDFITAHADRFRY